MSLIVLFRSKYKRTQRLPKVWNSWTSPKTVFLPLWCFARLLLQLTSDAVCLWVFLPLVLSSASEMHAQLGWNQETDSAIAEYSTFFTFKNSWVAFAVCFGSSSICTMKRRPINFAPFDWIWAENISLYTSEFFRLLLSSVTSSINTSNPVPLEGMHAHAITLLHHVSQMMLYALDHELFQAFSILFSSRHSGTGQVDLNFSCPKNAFPEVVCLF